MKNGQKKLTQKVLLHFYPCMGTYVHHAKYQEGFHGFKNMYNFFKKSSLLMKKNQFKGGLFEKMVCILGVMKPSLIFGVVEIGSHVK